MNLSILISTINKGIYNLGNVILNPIEDVEYIVCHQYTEQKFKKIPKDLVRNDVKIIHLAGKGVAKSRNQALNLSCTDLCLFADDDVNYEESYFETIFREFKKDNDMDVGIFKIKTPDGDPEYRNFSNEKYTLTKSEPIGTIQLVVKKKRIDECRIRFDERFGVGNSYLIASEERIFIDDCIKSGLSVKYLPFYIVEHEFESTIRKIPTFDKRMNRLAGGVHARLSGWKSIPAAFYYTIKLTPTFLKKRENPIRYLGQRLLASIYILATNRKSKKINEKILKSSIERE